MKQDSNPSQRAAHNRWWQIGEVVFGLPLLLAFVLEWLFPLGFFEALPALVLYLGGALLIVIAVSVIVSARRAFARHGQPTDPGHPTREMISSGIFGFSRNPLYLGAALFVLGVSVFAGLSWMLILFIPMLMLCHVILILPEERYLLDLFGDTYRLYTKRVHRWIGRSRID
jgi:protein-S-isoprenylcysteine O-methyltransferase Ste14